jgi:hypothetical protein
MLIVRTLFGDAAIFGREGRLAERRMHANPVS